jgi:hypothetical protein
VIRAFASRAISTDARMLGDLTVSMLRGREGVLRKEFDKLVDWIREEPPPDIIDLPNSLLIALAAPLKSAFGRPVCCTLQGEELFLNGLMSPYREQALAMIREQVRTIDRFVAVSDYCAGFMTQFLAIPRSQTSVVPLGITLDGAKYHVAQMLSKLGVIRYDNLGDFTVTPHRIVRDTLFRLGFTQTPYANDNAALTAATRAARKAVPDGPADEILTLFALAAGCGAPSFAFDPDREEGVHGAVPLAARGGGARRDRRPHPCP